MAVRAIFRRCAAFLTCPLPAEPLCMHMVASLELVPPSAGGGGRWEQQAARLLVLRAFRATAPAELQEQLRDEGVAAPDDPVMQELAPLVAAVQTLPPVTRQQLLQLWQGTLQLVQGGSSPRQPAALASDADAMTVARTPAARTRGPKPGHGTTSATPAFPNQALI